MPSYDDDPQAADDRRRAKNVIGPSRGAESSWSDFEIRAAGYAQDRMNEARADVMLDAIQVIEAIPDKVDSVLRKAVVKELDNRKIVEGALSSAEDQVHDHLKGLASNIIASMRQWQRKEDDDDDDNSVISDMLSLTQTIQDSTQQKLEISLVQFRDSHVDGDVLETIPEDWPLEVADAVKSATENQVNEAVSILREGITGELPPYVQNHSIAYAFLKAKIGQEDILPTIRDHWGESGCSLASGAEVESSRTVTCAETVATSEDWTDAKEYMAKASLTKLSWADMSEVWDDDDWAPLCSSRMSEHLSDFSLEAVAGDMSDVSSVVTRTGRANSADESSAALDKGRANGRRKKTTSIPCMFHRSISCSAAQISPIRPLNRHNLRNSSTVSSFDDGSSTDERSHSRGVRVMSLRKWSNDHAAEHRGGHVNRMLSGNTGRGASGTRSEPIRNNYRRGHAVPVPAGTRLTAHDGVGVAREENNHHSASKHYGSGNGNRHAQYSATEGGDTVGAASRSKGYAAPEMWQKRSSKAAFNFANRDPVSSSSSCVRVSSRLLGRHDDRPAPHLPAPLWAINDAPRSPASMRSGGFALKAPVASGTHMCEGHLDSLEEETSAVVPMTNKYIPKTKVQNDGHQITAHTMTLNLPKHGSAASASAQRKKDDNGLTDGPKNGLNAAVLGCNPEGCVALPTTRSSAKDLKPKETPSPLEFRKSEPPPISNRGTRDVLRTNNSLAPDTVSPLVSPLSPLDKSEDLLASDSTLDKKSETAGTSSAHYHPPCSSPATWPSSPAPLPLVPRVQKNKTKAVDDNAVRAPQIAPSRIRRDRNSAAAAPPQCSSRDNLSENEDDDENTSTPTDAARRLDSDDSTRHASISAGSKLRRKQKRSIAPDNIDRRMRRCITDVNLFGGAGSQGHPNLCARVCLYFWKGECRNGKECHYCHFPHLMRPPRFDKRHRSVLHDTPFDKFVYLLQKACLHKAQCWPVEELNEALAKLFDGLPSRPVKIKRISSIIDCMPLQYLIQLFRRGAEQKLPEGERLDFIRAQTDNLNNILSFVRARTTRQKPERAKSL
eukprot:GEMP01002245.1.p1 GENE.GEMP01002245.1~~GEMP01002245.1.p1  ORF type:complete len:1064 (-),score=235.65 GEMP01002245.1:1504-4695(-)